MLPTLTGVGGASAPGIRTSALTLSTYSLDPELVGRRVEVRVFRRAKFWAAALDTGEVACRHERCFAKHRTVTALEHARALRARHGHAGDDLLVEQRSSVCDQLIA